MPYGIGTLGNATWKDNKRAYSVWAGMLRRSNDKNHNRYKETIGVCQEWLSFECFLNDIVKLQGWDKEKFESGEIQLDKDSKQFECAIKIYSPLTCIWLNKKDNNSLQSAHCYFFKAVSPDGAEYVYNNQHECARQHDLSVVHINKCIKGIKKSHKKWTFQKI